MMAKQKPTDDNDEAWHDYFDDAYTSRDPLPEGVTRRTHYLQKVTMEIVDDKGRSTSSSSAFRWITRPRMHCVLSRKAD